MRKAVEVLFAAVLFFYVPEILAHETKCYFLLSYGKAKVNYMGTTQLEDRLFAQNHVVGSYVAYPDSNPHSFGLGCGLTKWLALEVAHREGLRADVISQVGLSGSYQGISYSTGTYEVRRHAELAGYSATFLGKFNMYGPLHATAKLGAMYGKASLSVTSPAIPYSIEATRKIEGVVPIGGIGIMWKEKGRRWSISYEKEKYDKYVTIDSIVWRMSF